MEIQASIEQENAALASEKWRSRPQIDMQQKFSFEVDTPNSMIQVSAPCAKTKLTFLQVLVNAAIEIGGEVLIIDCDNSIKCGLLLQYFSSEQLATCVHFYKIDQWETFCTFANIIPQLMFQLPNVAAIVVSGICNPYFYHQKRRCDKQILSMTQFVNQQLDAMRRKFRYYQIPMFICQQQETDDADQWHSSLSGKIYYVKQNGDKCIVKLQKSPSEQALEINCDGDHQ